MSGSPEKGFCSNTILGNQPDLPFHKISTRHTDASIYRRAETESITDQGLKVFYIARSKRWKTPWDQQTLIVSRDPFGNDEPSSLFADPTGTSGGDSSLGSENN
jgi:hypothetical protein